MSRPFRVLGLGGGGMKGLLHIGALQELSKIQSLEFDAIYGTSIGSIIGTALAFRVPLDNIVRIAKEYLRPEKFTPTINIQSVKTGYSAKGLFTMDTFESTLISAFQSEGIDLRKKVLGDAPIPLHVVTSNLTSGRPAILSKNVPVVDALKCSCCIPATFRPQVLYNQIYIDGGAFAPCIASVIPEKDALCFSLTKRTTKITPKNIDSIGLVDYIETIYGHAFNVWHSSQATQNTVELYHPSLSSYTDVEEDEYEDIFESGRTSLRNFLRSKRTD